MSATNSTPTYGLPLFEANDVPSWQGDFNEAMNKIDEAIAESVVDISGIESNIATLGTNLTNLTNRVASDEGDIDNLETAQGVLEQSLNNRYIEMTPFSDYVASLMLGSFKTLYYNRNSVQIMVGVRITSLTNVPTVTIQGVNFYALPLYHFSENIFNLTGSTLNDTNNKYKLMPLSAVTTGGVQDPSACFAMWDGSKTIIGCWLNVNTGFTANAKLWGSVTSLNANIIE